MSLPPVAHLVRWLGPWASPTKLPGGILRRLIRIPSPGGDPARTLRAFLYLPQHKTPTGAWIIAHGLHFQGPDDLRLDRFARVLASSGKVVMVPFVPDYMNLEVSPRAIDDFQDCFRAFLARPELPAGLRPAVWSVSFGSLLALRLASAPDLADKVSAVMTFGGYADWAETVRFCLTGQIEGQAQAYHDPLNRPVIFLNLLRHMSMAPKNPEEIKQAWRQVARETWSLATRDKRPELLPSIAQKLALSLPKAQRHLFLAGCGQTEDSDQIALEALEAGRASFLYMDPRPYLSGLRCSAHLVHGVEDDVIPVQQAFRLEEAMPAAVSVKCWMTGLYGHSASGGTGGHSARALWNELRTMTGMLGALASPST